MRKIVSKFAILLTICLITFGCYYPPSSTDPNCPSRWQDSMQNSFCDGETCEMIARNAMIEAEINRRNGCYYK